MTATLPTRYQSIRTFGLDKPEIIVPSGKAGAAQRLFIFANGKTNESAYEEVRELAAPRKACVIVPSGQAAEKWTDIAQLYESKAGHAAINEFKSATDARKIILAALYDGIDLPGKSCNVLILDGLPRGSNLHDQFLEESLDIHSFRASSIAARTTQAIGRIFRSNTDHGVVILAEKGQQSWLMDPENLAFIPTLLQQQIRLGFAIRKLVDQGGAQFSELMEAVINGRSDWDKFYTREVAKLEVGKKPKESKWGEQAAKLEYDAFREMWEGRYESAAKILLGLATGAESNDSAHAAWYLHWVGVAYLHAGKVDEANSFFWQASNKKLSLGRPVLQTTTTGLKPTTPGPQARRVSEQLEQGFRSSIPGIIAKLSGDGGKNAEDHEQNLKLLGERLGFVGHRPDKSSRKGPDVVWELPELKIVVAIEAKTQKESPKLYRKNKHVGKILNDCIWLEENFPGYQRRLLLIGPLSAIVQQASPPQDLRILQLSEFIGMAERLQSAAQNIVARIDASHTAPDAVQSAFEHYGLLWPDCMDAMDYALAADLQVKEEPDDQDDPPI